ncbi:MAG: calcium/sodium antiporter [Clostridia bacterium]|nr:calcium/sodium antiporter [Clostridia bacterium]
MELLLAILMLVGGIILIVKGGDWFVDSASWIARAAKIPAFIIGATIVSFATTLPELLVSVLASIEGKNDMAIGNAVGSIIANTGLIMAIAFTFMSIMTPRRNYWQQCFLLVTSTIILWIGCLHGSLSLWASLILLLICVVFIAINIIQGRHEASQSKISEPLPDIKQTKENNEDIIVNKKTICKNICFFFLGAIGVILGSNLLINGGSTIAEKLGIPERLIAITLVAVGTSLPELVTTVTAIRKKEGSLSAGNIIGANIIDLTLILPVCSFIAHDTFTVAQQSLMIDFPFALIISLIAVIPILWKQRTYKWQGILMLVAYVAYLSISIIL